MLRGLLLLFVPQLALAWTIRQADVTLKDTTVRSGGAVAQMQVTLHADQMPPSLPYSNFHFTFGLKKPDGQVIWFDAVQAIARADGNNLQFNFPYIFPAASSEMDLTLALQIENPGRQNFFFDFPGSRTLRGTLTGQPSIPIGGGALSSAVDLVTINGSLRSISGYYVDTLKLQFGGVDRNNETATSRYVLMLITACVKDPLMFDPIRYHQFRVETMPIVTNASDYSENVSYAGEPSHSIDVTSDAMGCIRWSEKIQHQVYLPERFYVLPFRLVDAVSQIHQPLAAVVNPWNTAWLFARDIKEVRLNDIVGEAKEKPELFLSYYKLASIGNEYQMDKYLRLTVRRKFLLQLSPEVVRHDSLTMGSVGGEDLRDGFYMLKIALVRASRIANAQDFVNSWEKIVEVKRGQINTEINLDVEDLTLMGNRNHLLFSIFPVEYTRLPKDKTPTQLNAAELSDGLIKTDLGLVSKTFWGPFTPIDEGSSSTLVNSPYEVQEVIKSGKAFLAKQELEYAAEHTLQRFDKMNRLLNLNLTDSSHQTWLRGGGILNDSDLNQKLPQLIESFTQMPKIESALAEKFCSLWSEKILPAMFKRYQAEDARRPLSTLNLENFKRLLRGFQAQCRFATRSGRDFFKLENVAQVDEIDNSSVNYLGGTSFNYNISSGFQLTKSENWDVRRAASSDWSFSASGGLDAGFMALKAAKTDSYSSSEAHTYGMGQSGNINYGRAAYLVVQHSLIRFDITRYHRCLIVKPSFQAIKVLFDSPLGKILGDQESAKQDSSWWSWVPFMVPKSIVEEENVSRFRDLIGDDRKLDVYETGLRICGAEVTEPLQAKEDYFYVTQHFTAGDMQDPRDPKNRPWLMKIRSKRDLLVYMHAIHRHNRLQNVGDLGQTPVEAMANSYADYSYRTPSFPGFLSIYQYDEKENHDCDSSRDFGTDFLNTWKEYLGGPLVWRDGKNMFNPNLDFWRVYYCPVTN